MTQRRSGGVHIIFYKKMQKLFLVFLFVLLECAKLLDASLFFPAASSLSMTSSVSVPVTEFFPESRIIVDWCFQMSYDLPSNPSSFYSVPIWPVKKVVKRDVLNGHNATHLSLYEKYNYQIHGNRHHNDFSAGELYQNIEDTFARNGFHETCLLKSVCELARHPFDDKDQNVLTQTLTFLLTPSVHQGFDASEQLYREAYENAEVHGFLGEDCAALYPDCKQDLLSLISETMFSKG